MSDMASSSANQSSDFEELKTQSTYISAIQDDRPHPDMKFQTCNMTQSITTMYSISNKEPPTFAAPALGPKYSVLDDHIILANSTEMVYQVPRNTTLLEVLGPVGTNDAWVGRSLCYVYLDPKPSYWAPPVAWSTSTKKKLHNYVANQTMFLIPLPPDTQYSVRVGNMGQDTTCPVGGFRSYPFHL